ncbi:MAG: hypothetical protein AAB490_05140 [Patescibacteria group bacterium]
MKNNSFARAIAAALVLIALAILLLDPLKLWMPNTMQMSLLIFLFIAAAVFAGFVWTEKGHDEREALHIMIAGRLAYITGIGIVTLGIIVQSMQHALDPWLIIILVAMVIAKIIGFIHAQINQ